MNCLNVIDDTERDRVIELKTRFILSEQGITYCTQKQIAVRDIITYEGLKKNGFHWQKFDARLVQRMFVNRLISEADIQSYELLSKRSEIIDLTKLLIYGIIYKQFKPAINDHILNSSLLAKIIKPSASYNLTDNLQFNQLSLKRFMEEKHTQIISLKESIAGDILLMINKEHGLTNNERSIKIKSLNKFIDHIDSSSWMLMHYANHGHDKIDIIRNMQKSITDQMDKTKIADYVSLVVMELAQNAERAHYNRLARLRKGNLNEAELSRLLRDKNFREGLKELARINGSYLNINFSYSKITLNKENRIRFQITLRNKGLIQEKNRRSIQNKSNTDSAKCTLASFYQDNNEEKLGAGLGLYYLSFLEEACRSINIKLETRISSIPDRDETLTMIIIYI